MTGKHRDYKNVTHPTFDSIYTQGATKYNLERV